MCVRDCVGLVRASVTENAPESPAVSLYAARHWGIPIKAFDMRVSTFCTVTKLGLFSVTEMPKLWYRLGVDFDLKGQNARERFFFGEKLLERNFSRLFVDLREWDTC